MQRYVCVHGHFYQPPRENPWLDSVETEDSAYPFHDWNERITAECYAQNAASRILDEEGFIARIVNNYERISFNFGPTLLSWMERNAPDVYAAILEGDRRSVSRFSGHGSAIAQVYNHIIMPLANERDKRTQIIWGIRDFERRFGRRPEGMWLAETAVDTATLEALADQSISFTVLAPNQARRVRQPDGEWQDIADGSVDTTQPYLVNLPSGRQINLFFYNGPLSRSVAFENLLDDGERLASSLVESIVEAGDGPRLAHIATDGETFGHHHRFGDMALAYALDRIESVGVAALTNYGEYLEKSPPVLEVEIVENSSWSCVHGVERWRSDCGCNIGGNRRGWNQAWRAPLRASMDWLRDELAAVFEHESTGLLTDPWVAREHYIDVILDGSEAARDAFLESNLEAGESNRQKALELLEMQRQGLLMFSSCAWFFDDMAGIETIQAMLHACRAIQLAERVSGAALEGEFIERLAEGRSNVAAEGTGGDIYKAFARTTRVELVNVGAHFAASLLFHDSDDDVPIGPYRLRLEGLRLLESGRSKLAVGRFEVTSDVTLENKSFRFAALHLGDQNLAGGIEENYDATGQSLDDALVWTFTRGDVTDTLRFIDSHFPGQRFSLRSLFRDEQRRIVEMLLVPVLAETEAAYRHVYENHISLIRFLTSIDSRIPNWLRVAAEVSLGFEMKRALSQDEIDEQKVLSLLDQASLAGIKIEAVDNAIEIKNTLARLAVRLAQDPWDREALDGLWSVASLLPRLGFEVDAWQAQNSFYDAVKAVRDRAGDGPEIEPEWLSRLEDLGKWLRVRVSA